MRRLAWIACAGLLLAGLSACRVPSPTGAPTATSEPAATLAPASTPAPTSTATAAVPTTAPTAEQRSQHHAVETFPPPTLPTAQPPMPSLTPTAAWGWRYWPNAVDFRAAAAGRDGDLWLAALSGLVHYEPGLGRWMVWTTADGLIDNTGESVTVWRDAVWIGTQGGVSRYDPRTGMWQSYTQDGLPGLHNVRLYLDEFAGTLWAGTSGGLARYEPESDRWQTERGDPVRHMWADASALWISVPPSSAQRGGLFRLDRATGRWQDIHLAPGSPPPDEYALTGSTHTLWAVGARGSVYEYDFATAAWREMSELYNRVDTLFQYPAYHDGQLWLSGSGRIVRVDVETGQIARVAYPEQPYFYPQHPPIWIGETAWIAAQSGLYALEGGQWVRHERLDLPPQIERVSGVCSSRLVLSAPGSPGFFDPHGGDRLAIQFPAGLSLTALSVACGPTEADEWLFDAEAGVLARHEPWTQFPLPEQLEPKRLLPHIDRDGRLWFAGDSALLAFDPQAQTWHTFETPGAGRIDAVQQESPHIWLILDGSALTRFDTGKAGFAVYPAPWGETWRHLAIDGQTAWLGGDSGQLLAFDIDRASWREVAPDRDCTGGAVNALAADKAAVWVGGMAGVLRLEPDGRQICLTMADGMLDNRVEQIVLTGDGWAWFANRWRGLWGYGPIAEGTK